MLDNFIFSVNIAMPIFLVMCGGYLLKRKGILGDTFIKAANDMIFYVALPIKLFDDLSKMSFESYFDIKFILFITLGTIGSFFTAWLIGSFLVKKPQLGAFVHGSFRSNFIYVGLSLMENLTGSIGLKGPLLVAFITPLNNILAVIILSFTSMVGGQAAKISLKDTFKGIIQNPLIIAIILGGIASQAGLKLPVMVTRTMGYFGEIVTPLALITMGAAFNFRKSSQNLLPSVYATALKLVIVPIIAVYLAIIMGFNNEDILLIFVLFGVPSATVSYLMTAAMNGDSDLSANIIMMTTLLSIVSMTMFVFVFKTIGIV